MAHRPKRTFRQRRADSSDSDSTQEPFAEPGAPGEQADLGPAEEGLQSGGGRAEAAELPRRARGRGRGRGRGRVWASSRHAARAASRLDGGSDVPGDAGQQDGCLGQQGGCPGRGVGRMGKEAAGFSRGFYNPLPTTNNDDTCLRSLACCLYLRIGPLGGVERILQGLGLSVFALSDKPSLIIYSFSAALYAYEEPKSSQKSLKIPNTPR